MTGFTEIAAAGPLLLALGVCVLAGLVSFASPCVVPLVPGYLSYLAGVVGVNEEPRPQPAARWRVAGRRRCSSPGSPRCSCWAPSPYSV
ncbi:cytochrome C biogenesis transmembrane region family protein [Mycobacterium kansasii 824]|nr:cytochrome C biogenesis transmembrane region family protein [Mycobacterium kansasii 824]